MAYYGCLPPLDHGDLAFALKTPWDNGTTHRVFAPLAFIGRLGGLTSATARPAPRAGESRHVQAQNALSGPPCGALSSGHVPLRR